MVNLAEENAIAAACNFIRQSTGEEFLRVMYAAHGGEIVSEKWAIECAAAGLLHNGSPTAAGYLVGCVAKEYLQWVDAGRKFADPKPTPDDLRRRSVVDVGCSSGRWMWYLGAHAESVVGMDIQPEFVALGEALSEREGRTMPPVILGSGAKIDEMFPAQSVDFVFARYSFNYLPIQPTLRRVFSVLQKGGELWIQPVMQSPLGGCIRVKSLAWAAWGTANSMLCNATGLQMRIRARGRTAAEHWICYPSQGCWRRMLGRAGFIGVTVTPYEHGFVVRGQKPR
jgi:SAM-dependent methyltransferase